jgi:DeoR family fructose operon transcriptional repressor
MLQAARAFLGCDALHVRRGLFAADTEGARVSATMLKNSEWRCVLADSSKIGSSAPVRYAGPDEIDLLITDGKVDQASLEELRSGMREVQVVSSEG